MRRRHLAVLAALLFGAPAAHAKDGNVQTCISAATEGQRLRDEGRFRAARERFAQCVAARCPSVIRDDCAKWDGEVEAATPSIVLVATDARGHDVPRARVQIDGEPFGPGLDGLPHALDPGSHRIVIVAPEGRAETPVMLRAGDGVRRVAIVLAAEPHPGAPPVVEAPRPVETSRPVWPLFVLGGAVIGTAALGGGMIALAHGQENDLARSCAPRCSDDDTAALRRSLVVGNVAFGASILALGAFVYFAFLAPPRTSTARLDVVRF